MNNIYVYLKNKMKSDNSIYLNTIIIIHQTIILTWNVLILGQHLDEGSDEGKEGEDGEDGPKRTSREYYICFLCEIDNDNSLSLYPHPQNIIIIIILTIIYNYNNKVNHIP